MKSTNQLLLIVAADASPRMSAPIRGLASAATIKLMRWNDIVHVRKCPVLPANVRMKVEMWRTNPNSSSSLRALLRIPSFLRVPVASLRDPLSGFARKCAMQTKKLKDRTHRLAATQSGAHLFRVQADAPLRVAAKRITDAHQNTPKCAKTSGSYIDFAGTKPTCARLGPTLGRHFTWMKNATWR